MHSVHFDDEADALGPASTTFTATKTFDHEGVFKYHCDVHPTLMKATVYVNATGTVPTPTPSPEPSPTASPGPTTTPPPGGGCTPPPGSTTAPALVFRVKAAVRRHRVTLTLTVGEAVRVKGALRRGSRRVRTATLLARPGRHKLELPGKQLKPGRYTLTLNAGDIKRVVHFRVRR